LEKSKSGERNVGKRVAGVSFRRRASERKVLRDDKAWCSLLDRKRAASRNSLGPRDRWVGVELIRVFRPKEGKAEDMSIGEYRMSKIVDEFTLVSKTIPRYRVSTMYKRKADKVRPVDPGGTDGSKPGGIPN
jgi:hypothetical protein